MRLEKQMVRMSKKRKRRILRTAREYMLIGLVLVILEFLLFWAIFIDLQEPSFRSHYKSGEVYTEYTSPTNAETN